jgi:hypothetical protein
MRKTCRTSAFDAMFRNQIAGRKIT